MQEIRPAVSLNSLSGKMDAGRFIAMLNRPQFLHAADKRQLAFKPGTILAKPDGIAFLASPTIDIDFALEGGKDYYVYATSDFPYILVSPDKITDGEAILIGGFHTLCADVGDGLAYSLNGRETPHPLSGYVAGDILPESVWCLNHRPHSEPEGMVYIPTLGFWCDIYLASGAGLDTKSAYKGKITHTRQIGDFIEDFMLVGKTLLDDTEFAAAMLGSNEQTSCGWNTYSDAVNNGAGGHSDEDGRRMISIYGVEEGCGMLWQFLRACTAEDGTRWQTQSGGKGDAYRCGIVIAGGHWSDGANCGSRARYANNARSHARSNVGGRGRSRHVSS